MNVVFVCFANTCRSPVAEVLLQRALDEGEDVTVSSRGLAGGPGDTPAPLIQALAARNLSLSHGTGATLQRDDARDADVLLFLERRLLRDAVVTDPSIWARSFTLREFVRRALANPPERDHETFAQWLAVLHGGRTRDDLLGASEIDDIADPGLGGDEAQFDAMIETLDRDVSRLAPFLSGWSTTSG